MPEEHQDLVRDKAQDSSAANCYWKMHRIKIRVGGEVLYAVTTGEIEEADPGEEWLSVTASELAWDAVLSRAPGNDTSAP